MINWMDIALLTLSCVLANHMGLINAVENVIKHRLPILNCVKCSTFWFSLFFCLLNNYNLIMSVAISFLLSYFAIWLELLFGFIDSCYEKTYKSIYKDSEATSSTKEDSDNSNSKSAESALP